MLSAVGFPLNTIMLLILDQWAYRFNVGVFYSKTDKLITR